MHQSYLRYFLKQIKDFYLSLSDKNKTLLSEYFSELVAYLNKATYFLYFTSLSQQARLSLIANLKKKLPPKKDSKASSEIFDFMEKLTIMILIKGKIKDLNYIHRIFVAQYSYIPVFITPASRLENKNIAKIEKSLRVSSDRVLKITILPPDISLINGYKVQVGNIKLDFSGKGKIESVLALLKNS